MIVKWVTFAMLLIVGSLGGYVVLESYNSIYDALATSPIGVYIDNQYTYFVDQWINWIPLWIVLGGLIYVVVSELRRNGYSES